MLVILLSIQLQKSFLLLFTVTDFQVKIQRRYIRENIVHVLYNFRQPPTSHLGKHSPWIKEDYRSSSILLNIKTLTLTFKFIFYSVIQNISKDFQRLPVKYLLWIMKQNCFKHICQKGKKILNYIFFVSFTSWQIYKWGRFGP